MFYELQITKDSVISKSIRIKLRISNVPFKYINGVAETKESA